MLTVAQTAVAADDINLLVIRVEHTTVQPTLPTAPTIGENDTMLNLTGRWQLRLGDDASWSNIPLPAKFGIGSDVLFEAR